MPCFHPVSIHYRDVLHHRDLIRTVPCGHCVDCCKHKQRDFSILSLREAQRRGSMVFTTLTFRNECMPMSFFYQFVSHETGEVRIKSFQLIDSTQNNKLTLIYYAHNSSSHKPLLVQNTYLPVTDLSADSSSIQDCDMQFYIVPSLDRRIVRLWLKRVRIQYLRSHGVSLPDFSYSIIGEYGSKHSRPHFHVPFYGLSIAQVRYMTSFWSFGYSYNVDIPLTDFGKVSSYVSKYVSKGCAESPLVLSKLVESPRRLS